MICSQSNVTMLEYGRDVGTTCLSKAKTLNENARRHPNTSLPISNQMSILYQYYNLSNTHQQNSRPAIGSAA
jgi:hypothetical protein